MTSRIAVIAHQQKSLGGGLPELRERLADAGVRDPLWFEVPKSSCAPSRVNEAIERGATDILAWGGDGMVQRCVDTLVGKQATLAIIPAGTANLFAGNLDIPHDLGEALDIALNGRNRVLDVGKMNGEHFAVMGGIGLDALMIEAAQGLKKRLGKAAYVWSGLQQIPATPMKIKVRVDGETWFKGDATCVLVANVSQLMGGITAMPDARPDDGCLDVAVVTATGRWQWTRTIARTATGHPDRSPMVEMTQAGKVSVETDKRTRYELDGGARGKTDHLKVKVIADAIVVRVPLNGTDDVGK